MNLTKAATFLLLGSTALLVGCSSGNLDDTKAHAEETWKQLGFTVVGYEGYQWGFWGFNSYGGAHVWYTLTRDNTGGKVTYTGALQKWGAEYHNTYLRAIDAVKAH